MTDPIYTYDTFGAKCPTCVEIRVFMVYNSTARCSRCEVHHPLEMFEGYGDESGGDEDG